MVNDVRSSLRRRAYGEWVLLPLPQLRPQLRPQRNVTPSPSHVLFVLPWMVKTRQRRTNTSSRSFHVLLNVFKYSIVTTAIFCLSPIFGFLAFSNAREPQRGSAAVQSEGVQFQPAPLAPCHISGSQGSAEEIWLAKSFSLLRCALRNPAADQLKGAPAAKARAFFKSGARNRAHCDAIQSGELKCELRREGGLEYRSDAA
eukprot:scaffold820_cov227-Pinguiococcus_pyrenoidosus.AAC.6